MNSREKWIIGLITAVLTAVLAYLTQSCSVLAVTAGKAKSSITQTTTTTTIVDSVSVSPFK